MDTKGMIEQEMTDAGNALVNWFKSQEIKPADGSLIMIRLIAAQLVNKTTDLAKLQIAMNNLTTILALDIVTELKRKLGS